jgi:uncharacterized membrane protein
MRAILEWLLGRGIVEAFGMGRPRLGFVADYGNYATLGILVALAGCLYLAARSYRREGPLERRPRAVLAALRLVTLSLICVALFRPALVFRAEETVHSVLAVLLDDSLSMSFTDRYADASQRETLAPLLEEPGDDPAQPSKPLEDVSRAELVRRALLQEGGAAIALARDHPLALLRFSTSRTGSEPYTRLLGEIDVTGAPAESAWPPADLAPSLANLTSDGHETDLRQALRGAMGLMEGRRLAGIVVVSDGQVTTQESPLAGVRDFARQRGVPLYAVGVGDPTPLRELRVAGLQAPRRVRRGGQVELTATLVLRNLGGRAATLRLLRRDARQSDWEETGITRKVTLESPPEAAPVGRSTQTVNLQIQPQDLGDFVYRVVAQVPDAGLAPEGLSADALMTVSDDKIGVLLISGDAGWEFRYLRNLLLRSPDQYRLSVWQQNAEEEVSQLSSSGMKLPRLPRTLSELIGSEDSPVQGGYDVVVLYDPQPTRGGFDGEFLQLLRTSVQRHGKGLCFIAGNKYTDGLLRGDGEFRPLADMLPVVLGANTFDAVERIERRRPEPWPLRLTSYGIDHPVTHLGGSTEETAALWNELPGVYWTHPVRSAKPTARVLAETPNPLRRTSGNRPEPVLVAGSYGKGRVMYVGFDATWRWRSVREGLHHRTFWGNVVRYLATLGARRVQISAGGDRFSAGQRISVEVEAYDEQYEPLRKETFPLRLLRGAAQMREIDLDAVSGSPGHFRGVVENLAPGDYELSPVDDPGGDIAAARRFTVTPPVAETARREADPATLRSLVSAPEHFVSLGQLDRLADVIPPGKLTAVRETAHELWDTKFALLAIVALLGVEWAMRKKHHLS